MVDLKDNAGNIIGSASHENGYIPEYKGDACTICGKTKREQMKGCNEITCYKGREGYIRV